MVCHSKEYTNMSSCHQAVLTLRIVVTAVEAAVGLIYHTISTSKHHLLISPYPCGCADVMAFSGPAPEIVNGRLAMLGFVAAVAAEFTSGESPHMRPDVIL